MLGMASLGGRKQEHRPKLMPVSAGAAVPAEAERAAVALSWPAAGMPANDDVRAACCDQVIQVRVNFQRFQAHSMVSSRHGSNALRGR